MGDADDNDRADDMTGGDPARHADTAPGSRLPSQEVADHNGLAMAGSKSVKDTVEKGDDEAAPKGAFVIAPLDRHQSIVDCAINVALPADKCPSNRRHEAVQNASRCRAWLC